MKFLDGYNWVESGITNHDGSTSFTDLAGNELRVGKFAQVEFDNQYIIIPGGFKNPLGLQFADPDGVEYIVMREIEQDYCLDDLKLNHQSIVIDIGAHVGVVSMNLTKRYGCVVDAYEPAPENYRRLVENILLNELSDFIIPHHLAVTCDGRPVTVGGPQEYNSGGMSIYEGIHPQCRYVPVDSVTLTQIIGDRLVDLLKIDCEGAEHEIFADLTPLKRVRAIRGEFHTMQCGDGRIIPANELLKLVQVVVPDTRVS
jgi:FkbM family methyltransferase